MRVDLAKILLCPAGDCGGGLTLEIGELASTEGEVRTGELRCAKCSKAYPIREGVPSFTSLFPEKLKAEADYWDRWYGSMWDMGRLGMFDIRQPIAPCTHLGITVPTPVIGSPDAAAGTLTVLAQDPAFAGSRLVLDVGCGGGWSSLYMARLGHRVVAFDPSEHNMRRAKAYALETAPGASLDYIAGAMGYLRFKEGVFDNVVCMHSLHHVPDVGREVERIAGWLRPGGVLALDEHLGTDPMLDCVGSEINEWFRTKVAPRYIVAAPESTESGQHEPLPVPAPSPMEDAGAEEWLEAVCSTFTVQWARSRFVGLDLFSYMHYLDRDCSVEAYKNAGAGMSTLYEWLAQMWPERVEYVTLLARKPGPKDSPLDSSELPPELARLLNGEHKDNGASAQRAGALQMLDELRATVDHLNRLIDEKNSHIERLETSARSAHEAWEQATADRAKLRTLIARIEQGKVMRGLRLVDRLRGRFRRG